MRTYGRNVKPLRKRAQDKSIEQIFREVYDDDSAQQWRDGRLTWGDAADAISAAYWYGEGGDLRPDVSDVVNEADGHRSEWPMYADPLTAQEWSRFRRVVDSIRLPPILSDAKIGVSLLKVDNRREAYPVVEITIVWAGKIWIYDRAL